MALQRVNVDSEQDTDQTAFKLIYITKNELQLIQIYIKLG